jgi:hypothetical protein
LAGKSEFAREFVLRMEKSMAEIRSMDADKYFPVETVDA